MIKVYMTYMYNQTCSNHHVYKTTVQSLLYKTTTCVTRPATTFFSLQKKKT